MEAFFSSINNPGGSSLGSAGTKGSVVGNSCRLPDRTLAPRSPRRPGAYKVVLGLQETPGGVIGDYSRAQSQ